MNDFTDLTFLKATTEDLDSIIRLLVDDKLGMKRESSGEDKDCYITAFDAIIHDDNAFLIVVKCQSKIIACAQLNIIQYLTYQGGKRAQIEGVRVDKTYRGKGVGKKLFQYLINFAKEKNCHLVQLTTDKKRPDAYQFYESLGFKNTHDGFKFHL